jgi:hypothetical protein
MRVACSWCLGQEEPALLGARTPLGDERVTYGICASHRREVPIGRYVRMLERRGRL